MSASGNPLLSLLIPTLNRADVLRDLLNSLAATTTRLDDIEVVLGVDPDDPATRAVAVPGVHIQHVTLPAGLTMGRMNQLCFEGSRGRYVMLMNDDVVVRTAGWDEQVVKVLRAFDDEIVLVHVNDGIFGEKLCTFPLVSRAFATIAGSICPTEYERYRIDDHIYGIFNLVAVLGQKRIVYLPDVMFEHLNFEQRDNGGKNYQFHSPTLDRDAVRFEDMMPERKRVAVSLVRHIAEHAGAARDIANAAALVPLTNSFALRRPEFVTVVTASTPMLRRERPLVTVVTSDMRLPHAQRCIDRIKALTTDCDLLIVDNFGDPQFNHARVMNELFDLCRSRWLVLFDDDVFVEPGWLEGLLAAAAEPGVGVVTPLHAGPNGRLSYSGVVAPLETAGEHSHSLDGPAGIRDTPTICSAAMLVDMTRCGHLRFDDRYRKYFHDLDYGLQAWEAGARVVTTPAVTVTHIGGGTLVQGSAGAMVQWERDRGAFVQAWIDSGRLAALRNGAWKKSAYIDGIYGIADDLDAILHSPAYDTDESWKRAIRDVLDRAKPIPILHRVLGELLPRLNATPLEGKPAWFGYRRSYLRNQMQGGSYHEEGEALRLTLDPLVEQWIADRRRVVIYGAGVHTEQLFRSTRLLRAPLVGIADRSTALHDTLLWGLPVVPPERMLELRPDIVLISSKAFQNEIVSALATVVPASVERVTLYGEDGSVRCADVKEPLQAQ